MGKRRFSKSEMRGFILLFIILTIAITLFNYREWIFPDTTITNNLSPEELAEIQRFQQQIEKDSIQKEQEFQRKRDAWKKREKRELHPFPFNPNTADSVTLAKIGLSDWQIHNILKYRNKGGKWKSEKDFARLYGLSKEDFQHLLPYLRIPKDSLLEAKKKEKAYRDSIRKSYPQKYEEGTILSVNDADTTALKGIPGIGSYYAKKICRYRERLGGFISLQQLDEIEGLPADIKKWFSINTSTPTKLLRINHCTFKELLRHPYLNYEQVKVITNYIRKYGKITGWDVIANGNIFTQKDIQRLTPYVTFE